MPFVIFLLLLEEWILNKFQSLMKYVSLSVAWPSLAQLFYKDFKYKLIKQKN